MLVRKLIYNKCNCGNICSFSSSSSSTIINDKNVLRHRERRNQKGSFNGVAYKHIYFTFFCESGILWKRESS